MSKRLSVEQRRSLFISSSPRGSAIDSLALIKFSAAEIVDKTKEQIGSIIKDLHRPDLWDMWAISSLCIYLSTITTVCFKTSLL